jgi:transposase
VPQKQLDGSQITGPAVDLRRFGAAHRMRSIRAAVHSGNYLGLVPKRYRSGEVDYVGGISKCGDRRVRTLLYEAANVMLTGYKEQLKLKDWAFAVAGRSNMRKARIALARRLVIIMHAMLRDGTEFLAA